jgi:hypothetical protein
MLSGIGPPQVLSKHDIPVVFPNEAVGLNLIDRKALIVALPLLKDLEGDDIASHDVAAKMLLNSEVYTGEEAHALGVVGSIHEDALTAAVELAQSIAQKPREAVHTLTQTLLVLSEYPSIRISESYPPTPPTLTLYRSIDACLQVGKTVRSYERPSAFVPLAVPFSQENQMQTPKMSLRRNMILKNYMPVIEGLYSGTAGYSCGTVPNKSDE